VKLKLPLNPRPESKPIPISEAFIEAHPLRIDFPDGTHVRFSGWRCTADSALWWAYGTPRYGPIIQVFDESVGVYVSLPELRALATV